MSSEPPVLAPQVCARCNAANYAHVKKCWLCHEVLAQNAGTDNPYATTSRLPLASQPASPQPAQGQSRVESVFMWLFLSIVILAVMVAIGLGRRDTGLMALFLFVLVPSLAAASVRGAVSVAHGETPKASSMLVTFAMSAMVTIIVGVAIVVSVIIFFIVTCGQMLSGVGPR